MRKLLESGSHFGHQTRRWNPKMKPYIYTAKNSVYIIDLQKTIVKLDDAYAEMKAIGERGGKVLFVGTKKQAQTIVLDEALRSGSFFINQRWLGGLLTNFRTIQKSIRRLVEIEEMEANGTINVYPKKEIAQLRKEAARLENFLGGIKDMKKLPDAIFVVDPTEEHNAVAEARKLHIPVFGIIDTNCDPDVVDFGIPANDDAIRSVKLIVGLMADALVESKGGVLSFAYQNQDEENERRRRQRMEERRSDTRRPYQNRGPREFDRNRPRPEGRSDATTSTPYAKPPVTSASTANVESTQAVVKPETVTPVAPQVEVETKPVVKPQVETVEVETKPVVKPQVEVVEVETKPVVKPQVEVVEVETKPVVKPQVEVVEVKTKPVVKPQVEKVVDKAEVVVEKPVKKATTKKAKEVVEPVVEEGKEVLPKAPRKTTKKTVKTEEENND